MCGTEIRAPEIGRARGQIIELPSASDADVASLVTQLVESVACTKKTE